MSNALLFSVNIAMEVTMILVLAIILITLLWQKKMFTTTLPLIYLTCSIILLMIVQIVTWFLLIYDIPLRYGAVPMRIVYVLDYIFSYLMTAAFYHYVEALAMDGYKSAGITFKPQKNVRIMIYVWGAVTTLIYAGLLWAPSLYHLENGEAVFSMLAFTMVHLMAKFACVCSMVFVIRHKKVIGKREAAMSFICLIMISVLVIIDELYDLCIGHILVTLFVFLLYISIDLQKGLLLERKEKEITEWKTQIMLSQMQPHFLYNVLTTISGMCEMQNANEARDVVNRFADYFRTNLESLGKEKTISFEKELEHIKTYLWLEKVRFEDALNVCYEIKTTDFAVPSLAVQPIVENAVKHGILPKGDSGTVTICTSETDIDYVITIKDDGVGFDVNETLNDEATHIGLENVRKRLEIICNGTLDVRSEIGMGSTVTIHIPKGDHQ